MCFFNDVCLLLDIIDFTFSTNWNRTKHIYNSIKLDATKAELMTSCYEHM